MKHFQNYESEFTEFLRDLKQEHPDIDKHQRDGRKLLWDKPPVPPDELKLAINSEVKLKPYVYE
ncbi:MAG TPA: DUF3460 family protein [Noviherbaspirillum sp.]|uniref:DUF3460 family protein n=1 Tax=Noviherbaspirillum sp. TaxID=1926288 RepID=UPI002B4A77AA|nr:DUF3460 family protein [Noviherbaspirillum sp.]HJV84372.1 DUF3460 family protein [Noviherbaspirillum sp.]